MLASAQPGRGAKTAADAARILIVDDDDAIRVMLDARLTRAGYRTRTARDAEEALALLGKEHIDLVLLDIMLPGIDGYGALEAVRKRFQFSVLPVIMLSAKDLGEDVIRALRLGANDYATKPVQFEVLLRRIAVHLGLATPEEQLLGGYRIHRKIGAGGMGIVYDATEAATGRPAAVKVLPRSLTVDQLFVRRFQQEAELAQRVDHPNVVKLFRAGVEGEVHFMAMELLEGHTLADRIEEARMEPPEALKMARQVAEGLHALHRAGVIHRDIKPENVYLSRDGGVKITDFGVARDVSAGRRLTESGIGVGSAGYASPEQVSGRGDFRSDIYSLGCTLFFSLTGHDAFPSDVVSELQLKPPPGVDRHEPELAKSLVKLVRRMMMPDPRDRFDSYDELLAAIDALLAAPRLLHRDRWQVWIWSGVAAGVALAGLLLWRLASYG
jgi:DNA-binding response OmpR family regulator